MGRRVRIELDDVLRLRYAAGGVNPELGVDCLWAVRTALERLYKGFRPEELPLDREAALALTRGDSQHWRVVIQADRIGDVLFGERPEPWVAVLADLDGLLAFTALPRLGTCMISIRRLGDVQAILRRAA
jgi:hypothetical protein